MARPKEFNREKALTEAMKVFWQKGYEGTSIQDLLDAMNINRGSLYDTFGDKQKLYIETLNKYCADYVSEALKPLQGKQSGFEELKEFLISSTEKTDDDCCGCFMGNSLVERGPSCCESASKVSCCIASMEDAIENAVVNAQKESKICSSCSSRDISRMLLITKLGLSAYERLGAGDEQNKEMIESVLTLLKGGVRSEC